MNDSRDSSDSRQKKKTLYTRARHHRHVAKNKKRQRRYLSPGREISWSAHIPTHDFGQFLLVNPGNLLLGNVVVLVLLESAILAVHTAILAERARTIQSAWALAVGVVRRIGLALSAQLHVSGLAEHVGDAFLAHVLADTWWRAAAAVVAVVAVTACPGLLGTTRERWHALLLA